MQKRFLAFLAAGVWISISEFVRNELLFKSYWLEKYSSIGMVFPAEPINNGLWGVWSFMLAGVIVYLLHRLRFVETIAVVWFSVFVLMWVVIGNLNVLPMGLLVFAVPLSMVEVAVAAWLGRTILGRPAA